MSYQVFPFNMPIVMNRASRQAQGLVGWWPAAANLERNLVLRDLSGRGNHLEVHTPQWVASEMGMTPYYSTLHWSSLASGVPVPADVTIAFWVKPITTASYRMCITRAGGTGSDWEIGLYGAGFYYGYNGGTVKSANMLSTTGWHLLALTVGPAGTLLYDNGLYMDGITTPATFRNGNGTFYIGTRSDGYYAEAYILDVRMYNRQLAQGEIMAMYAPATRWELYGVSDRSYLVAGAPPAATARSWGVVIG